MMKDWKKSLISADTPLIDVIKVIEKSDHKVGMVVDSDRRLLGMITDGDIRRAIIKGVTMDESAETVMFKDFIYAKENMDTPSIISIMQKSLLRHIPVIDNCNRVVDLKVLSDYFDKQKNDNWVVIMAGGLGKRLRPLTDDCPKPMLKVGGKPILEIIINNFFKYNFTNFFISINYKSDLIENYFEDGLRFGVKIEYLREEKKLGTAGSLSLLPSRPEMPFIVINADLLTTFDFRQLLNFHLDHDAHATMCVREYNIGVPYGVVKTDEDNIIKIDEKPNHKFFINAGIYMMEPIIFDYIPHNTYLDMPILFKELMDNGCSTVAFPIFEYWLDIGKLKDFKQGNGDYRKLFSEE